MENYASLTRTSSPTGENRDDQDSSIYEQPYANVKHILRKSSNKPAKINEDVEQGASFPNHDDGDK